MQKKFQDDYYKPSEDTFFLADYIEKERGHAALDIGTGSGYLAGVLSGKFELVVATDISMAALKKAADKVQNLVCCESADAINYGFDLVVCNLPYLPSDKVEDSAVDGLEEGLGVTTKIIKSASRVTRKNGKMVYLTSSLSNYPELVKRTKELGFAVSIVARKRFFFEELVIVQCVRL